MKRQLSVVNPDILKIHLCSDNLETENAITQVHDKKLIKFFGCYFKDMSSLSNFIKNNQLITLELDHVIIGTNILNEALKSQITLKTLSITYSVINAFSFLNNLNLKKFLINLTLQNNVINDKEALLSFINNSIALKNLDISHNTWPKEYDIKPLFKCITQKSTLRSLQFAGNNIDNSNIKVFLLNGSKTLTDLNFTGNNIEELPPQGFINFPKLLHIKISDNLINNKKFLAKTPGKFLTNLQLNNIGLCDYDIQKVFGYSAEKKWPFLHTIGLQKNKLTKEGFECFIEAFKESTTLYSLDIASNNVTGAIKHLKKVKWPLFFLYLGNNCLEDSDIFDFTRVLKKNLQLKKLDTLDFSDNRITAFGIQSLIKVINDFITTLNYLNLSSNFISSEGYFKEFNIICNDIKANSSLTTLELQENNISSNINISFNPALKKVGIDYDSEKYHYNSILKIVNSNATLTTLNIHLKNVVVHQDLLKKLSEISHRRFPLTINFIHHPEITRVKLGSEKKCDDSDICTVRSHLY